MILKNSLTKDDDEKKLVIAFKAVKRILDHMKIVRIQPTAATVRIFAVDTNNQSLMGLFYSKEQNVLSEYNSELLMYIGNKILLLIDSAINLIPKDSFTFANSFVNEEVKREIASLFNNPNEILSKEIFRFEDIMRHKAKLSKTDISSGDKRNDLVESNVQNIFGYLAELIRHFKEIKYYNSSVADRYKTITENDIRMKTSLGIQIGYLIAFLVVEILTEFSNIPSGDYDELEKEFDEHHIYDDYIRYGIVGSFSISNLLCCFGKCELLSLAVESQTMKLDKTAAGILRNVLVVQKLTRKE